MHTRKPRSEYLMTGIVILLLFAMGVVLGAVLVFYTPKNLIEEARLSFSVAEGGGMNLIGLFKNSFIIEFLWMFSIWLLVFGSVTAPLASAVMALRGLLIGFSMEFIISGSKNIKEVIFTGILPQCLFGLPVMCVFTVLCFKFANERRHGGFEGKYFVLGGVFTLVCLAASFLESLVTMLFINIV